MAKIAMLYDSSRCTACRGCQVACKQWNDLPAERTSNWGSYENPPALSPSTYTRIRFIEAGTSAAPKFLFFKQGCMHCTDAACVKVCPTGALSYDASGAVIFDRDKCNGCGYCSQFCPFEIPKLEGDVLTGAAKSSKCHLCIDRISNGEQPACVKTCPAGALSFGEQAATVQKGRQRVQTLRANGHPNANLYGDEILGGLHRMYVLEEPPEVYGLPRNPQVPVTAGLWKDLVQQGGTAVFGLATVGVGLAWVIARRNIRMQDEQ